MDSKPFWYTWFMLVTALLGGQMSTFLYNYSFGLTVTNIVVIVLVWWLSVKKIHKYYEEKHGGDDVGE